MQIFEYVAFLFPYDIASLANLYIDFSRLVCIFLWDQGHTLHISCDNIGKNNITTGNALCSNKKY